jgi:hypothetical protein
LTANDIDDEDAQALAGALIDNQALQKLYLLGNQVQDAGAEALARALRENAALQELHLVDNQLPLIYPFLATRTGCLKVCEPTL